MSKFSFLPLIKIIGRTEMSVENSPVVEKIIVDDSQIKFKLKESTNLQEVILLDFNIRPGINELHDEIVKLPLELMFTTTIDFLDAFSNKFDLSTVLFDETSSNNNFVETFLYIGERVYLPFQVRKPSTKTLYSSVFTLLPIRSNLMAPIEVLSDQYEDYIENALYSFLLNVSKPIREKEHEEYVKSQELLKVLDRIEDLSQIVTAQLNNVKERYRAFSRVMAPLIASANLKKKISDSIKVEITKDAISYQLQYPVEITSNEIAEFIVNRLKSEQ